MLTEKLYDNEPYNTEFDAKVVEIKPSSDGCHEVVLDRTLFFPEEGGQTPDKGKLGSFSVVHVSIEDGIITHTISGDAILPSPGDDIYGVIDWEHRFSNMQNHSAEHILSGLLHSRWQSENTGFHLSDNIVTLDTSKELEPSDIRILEEAANRAVWSDLPVSCRYYSPDELKDMEYRSKLEFTGEARIVTIPGVDVCACCAPHVGRTGEIGIIKIIKAIRYKGGMRFTILAGKRAYEYLSNIQDTTDRISHTLSESPEKICDAVQRILNENTGLKLRLKNAEAERLAEAIASVPEGSADAVLFTGNIDNLVQRNAVNTLTEAHRGICAVFASDGGDSWKYILSWPSGDSRQASKLLGEKLEARGGGSKEMVQGSVKATKEQLLALLKSPL